MQFNQARLNITCGKFPDKRQRYIYKSMYICKKKKKL
jgi:hypothetical protein